MNKNLKLSALTLSILTSSVLSLNAMADEEVTRAYKKKDADSAEVTIRSNEISQAAILVDRVENKKFLDELLKDKESKLSKLKAEIEMEYCGEVSKDETGYIDGCGSVVISDYVLTSYGRGGWASAGASYSMFIGFRMDGTGRFLESTHIVDFSEGVEALENSENDSEITFVKYLSLGKITKLESQE